MDQESDRPYLTENEFVRRMVPDPRVRPANRHRVVGLLGRDVEPDVWRVYFSPRLDSYVRVSADDIVDAVPMPGSRLGRTILYLKPTTTLLPVEEGPQSVQASFLEGRVMADMGGVFCDPVMLAPRDEGSGAYLPGSRAGGDLGFWPVTGTVMTVTVPITVTITVSVIGHCVPSPPPVPTDPAGSAVSCCLCTFGPPKCPPDGGVA